MAIVNPVFFDKELGISFGGSVMGGGSEGMRVPQQKENEIPYVLGMLNERVNSINEKLINLANKLNPVLREIDVKASGENDKRTFSSPLARDIYGIELKLCELDFAVLHLVNTIEL